MKNAIILCSGGIDSVVTSYYVKKKLGYGKLIILFFNYGQRTLNQERTCSKRCAKKLNAEFIEMELKELEKLSTSLINKSKKAKKISRKDLKNTSKESEKFYVPCRNTIFLVHAFALAESLFIREKKVYDIFTGFKCEGAESYPDTTEKFIKKINEIASISCMKKFRIIAPMIKKDKEDIIKLGKKLGVDFKKTFSCYIGAEKSQKHCGTCLACRLRQEGFYWANIKDPTDYQRKMKDFRIAKN